MSPGTVLGERYRVDAALGQGAMGKVYAGEHVLLRKKVAIKILRGDRANVPEVVARFEREAMAAANIEHPNIAGASDFGRLEDGSVYLVLEYVQGKNLRDEIQAGPLPVARSLHIARQITSALAAAGDLGIVHRDLKPENIMLVEKRGESDFVKVLDFGIARVPMAESEQRSLTKTGIVFGTPEYMAPEQALGSRVDARADLYALGVILFEMLTGVRPYPDGARNLGQKLAHGPPRFRDRAPEVDVPDALLPFVQKALAPNVIKRFQDAREALLELDRLIESQGLAAPAAAPSPSRVPSRPPPPPRRSAAPPAPAAPQDAPRLQTFLPGDPLPSFELPSDAGSTTVENAGMPDALTLVRAPTVDSLPPRSEPPSSGPPAAPPGPAVSPARPPGASWLARLGERTLALHRRACHFIDLRRDRLPLFVRRRVKRAPASTLLAAAAGLAFLTLVAVLVAMKLASRASGDDASSPSAALREPPPSSAAQEPAPVPSSNVALLSASATPKPSAEEALVELAHEQLGRGEEAESLALVQRALAADPKLVDDPRVAEVLSGVARSESRAGDDAVFAALTGPMGGRGAEVLYDLSLDERAPERVRKRARDWLATREFDRVSSPALYSAVKLRNAQTCQQKFHLLKLAGNVGGKRTLAYLRELEGRTRCPSAQRDCYACLETEDRLKQTIARIEEREAAGDVSAGR